MIEDVGIYLIFCPSLLCRCNQLWKKYIVFYLSWVSLLFHMCVQRDPWLWQIVYVISVAGRKGDELKTRYKKESDSHPQRQNFLMKGNRDRRKRKKISISQFCSLQEEWNHEVFPFLSLTISLSLEFGTFHVKVLLVKTLDTEKAAEIWVQSHCKVFYAVSSPSLMPIENSSCPFLLRGIW